MKILKKIFDKIKKYLHLILITIMVIIIAIITIFLMNNEKVEVYIQPEKDIEEIQTTTNSDLLGTITIEKIGLINAPTEEGTDLKILANYIGHFEETPLLSGNIAFCSHNRGWENGSYFARLHELEKGDKIVYKNMKGTHTYIVNSIKEIDETDFSILKNTEDERLTLITCVADKKEKRLCVTALLEDTKN